jgi:putative ABC transport system substrate-binding protein
MKYLKLFLLSFILLFIASPVLHAADGSGETIGISKIVAHPALDAIEKGIMDELKAQGYKFRFDLQNANGDVNTAASIASKFKADRVRFAVGIATPTAQALVQKINDIPVIFSAVTDPVDAGLVKSLNESGDNVTGVSDMTPVKEQIELMLKLKKIKTLGHIYSSGEANAVVLAGKAKQACKDLGLEFVETTVTNSAEVKQAVQTIIRRVDAIYISTDNTVVSALKAITDVAEKNGKPIISADPSSAEKFPILVAWGFDYYKMGRATGKLILSIYNGKKTRDIPTVFMTDPSDVDLLINMDVAKKLRIKVPDDIRKSANTLVINNKVVKNK